jgi:hypothetical protein
MWWQYLIVVVVAVFAVWGFLSVVKLQTRRMSARTGNTAEDVYDRYADPLPKQRKYAEQHGGEWRNK